MPRRRTQFVQGAYYHIYNRGAGRQGLFREADNYVFVLRQVKRYAARYTVAIIACSLMPTHYHLLLRQDGDVSAGLLPQHVFNSYTKAFNKRYGHSGTLFEGRFEALRVDKEAHLTHLCRYIHCNPVKAGLVADPGEWPYSNYLECIGARQGTLVDRAFMQTHFPQAAEYRRFVGDYLLDDRAVPAGIEAYRFDDK